MPVSEEYLEHVVEKLEYIGQVTTKKMFGGVGIYLDGLFCALIGDDVLYFKVDDTNRPDYEAADMGPLMNLQYYQVPAEVFEDPETLRVWANKAMDVARRKSSGKKRKNS